MTETNLREKYLKSVTVTWIDSSSSHGWNYEDDVLKLTPCEIRTMGYLIKETDDYVVVSASVADHQIDSPICIPKICITDIENRREQVLCGGKLSSQTTRPRASEWRKV